MAIDSLQLDTKHKTIYLTTKGILVSMKYNNQKKTVDGLTFDSILEARRYTVLKSRLEAGTISDLRLQPHYTIMEGYKDLSGTYIRPVQYIADFSYIINEDGRRIVEDAKGVRTEAYAIKRKLVRDRFGVDVVEITAKNVAQ